MTMKNKSNKEKIRWLEDQIKVRISLSQEKLSGKHVGLDVPTSLRQNRIWENADYGVERIGSPSSFKTTHKKHGKYVKQLNALLVKLRGPTKRKYKPLRETVEQLTYENESLKDNLVKTANQFVEWQSELDDMRDMLQITQSSEQGLIESKEGLQQALKEKDEIIKRLRMELVQARNADATSTITEVDFGGDKT
jgi:chromosome segregation ATPase